MIRSFPQRSKAFQIFMSVFLLKPENVEEAAKMLKYMQTVRNLSERGSNWRGYDGSFRALRAMQGWSWDSVNYELWLNAAHQPRLVSQGESLFLDRGVGNRGARICRAYNRGRCAYNVSPPFPSVSLENLDRAMPSPVLPSALDQMLQGYDVGKRKF